MIVFLLLLATHGSVSFLGGSADVAEQAGVFNRLTMSILTWTLGIPLMARGARRWPGALTQNKILFAMPLVALASTAWSAEVKTTLSTSLYLILTTVFAVFFATYFPAKQQMRFLLPVGLLASVASLILGLVAPGIGMDQLADRSALQGIYVGKNVCGLSTVFLLLPALYYKPRKISLRVSCWLYVVLLLGVLVLTRSRTSQAMAILCILFSVALKALRRIRRPDVLLPIIVTSIVSIVGAYILWLYLGGLLLAIGSDSSLHGRGPLWEILWAVILRRPWLGYGYTGFWTNELSDEVNSYVGWYPRYAHNGFFEILLAVGVVGLLCLLPVLIRAIKDAIAAFYSRRGEQSDWYITMVLITVIYNVDEAYLGAFNNLTWVLFLVASIALARAGKQTVTSELGAPSLVSTESVAA